MHNRQRQDRDPNRTTVRLRCKRMDESPSSLSLYVEIRLDFWGCSIQRNVVHLYMERLAPYFVSPSCLLHESEADPLNPERKYFNSLMCCVAQSVRSDVFQSLFLERSEQMHPLPITAQV